MLTKVDELIGLSPFNYDKYDRYSLFKESLNEVAKHHFENCEEYRNFCKNNNFDRKQLFFCAYFHRKRHRPCER